VVVGIPDNEMYVEIVDSVDTLAAVASGPGFGVGVELELGLELGPEIGLEVGVGVGVGVEAEEVAVQKKELEEQVLFRRGHRRKLKAHLKDLPLVVVAVVVVVVVAVVVLLSRFDFGGT